MRTATELMERASNYRRMSRSEHDPRVRDMLMEVSRDYDARVSARLKILEDEWIAG